MADFERKGSEFPEYLFILQMQKMFSKDRYKSFYHDLFYCPFLVIRPLFRNNSTVQSPNRTVVYLRKDTGNIKIAVWKNLIQKTGSCGKKKVKDPLILIGWLNYTYF